MEKVGKETTSSALNKHRYTQFFYLNFFNSFFLINRKSQVYTY